jgi:hypothetical protein
MIVCSACGELIAQEVAQDALLWAVHRFVKHTDLFTKVIVAVVAAGIASSARNYLNGR